MLKPITVELATHIKPANWLRDDPPIVVTTRRNGKRVETVAMIDIDENDYTVEEVEALAESLKQTAQHMKEEQKRWNKS